MQSTEGAVLLLAVPGSGKTTVLVNRLGYMIYEKKILPEQILTVTYTVAATADMRRRFLERFGEEYCDRLEFRTINGLSQKVLQYFGYLTGKEVFRVADKEAGVIVKEVFRQVTGRFPTENDIKIVQTGITYVKNMRLSEKEIREMQVDVDKFAEIYDSYNKELRRQAMIDYDDQMVYALKILEQYPEVLGAFQEKYRYICVDEAQDTSKIQHDMIRLLAKKSGNLFMVGDEDQSIYGFRAAYPEALVMFDQVYRDAKVLLMETNYRSNAEIVGAADWLIQRNKNRHKKHMQSCKGVGGRVTQIKAKSRKGQYHYLLEVAKNCDRETAVLYRNNESALPLIDLLEREKIPYRMKSSDMTFFSHPVVNDLKDFLTLACNPWDEEAFLRIYYKMGAGISKICAMKAVENNRRKQTLLEMVADMEEASPYTQRQCLALAAHFMQMKGENAGEAIYRILRSMGYQEFMESRNMEEGKAQTLRILGEQEDVPGLLDRLNVLQDLVANGCGQKDSPFLLSTIHSSKGLEYDCVYMIDMLSTLNKGDPEEEEEERRLFYVGMTRAKRELYIFSFSEGETSRFTKEVFLREEGKRLPVAEKKVALSQQYRSGSPYEKRELPNVQAGNRVLHKKYGKGTVLECSGDFASIRFDREEAVKKMSLAVAMANGMKIL